MINSLLFNLGSLWFQDMDDFEGERDWIIVHKRTSHPSNLETWPLYKVLLFHFKWVWAKYFGVFKANFGVESTKKNDRRVAYMFLAYMSDEHEVRSYTIIPCLHYEGCLKLEALIGIPRHSKIKSPTIGIVIGYKRCYVSWYLVHPTTYRPPSHMLRGGGEGGWVSEIYSTNHVGT